MGCMVVCLRGDEALGIGPPREFDNLQEVDQDLSEAFEVVVGGFPGDGRQLDRTVLEDEITSLIVDILCSRIWVN